MNETDYNARLYEKMKAEQDKYRDWLLHQEPSEILNHTYEYTMREDIVMCMEELELEPEKARALLRSPCPLSDVYKEFRDRETEHMDTIRDSIETEADTTFDWYVNLNGTADVKATFTAEGRKKSCIIKLEEIEKISSLHRKENEDNAHLIKNPIVFAFLHRPRSRTCSNRRYTSVPIK